MPGRESEARVRETQYREARVREMQYGEARVREMQYRESYLIPVVWWLMQIIHSRCSLQLL